MRDLTQTEIKELYLYNPETGSIKRRSDRVLGMEVARNGYLRLRYRGRSCSAQKVIWKYMTGAWPNGDIDHIDHDRLNNKWSNLRLVSRQENMRNASRSKANTSGYTGVTWCKQQLQWQAQITVDGKSKKLGRFDSIQDAVEARKKANKRYNFHSNHGAQANA